MAHFVKLDENNVVVTGVVVNNDAIDLENEEASGIEFLNNLYGTNDVWKRTSYNAATNGYRFNYAGIGYTFDATKGSDGAFIAPRPTCGHSELTLDETTCRWVCTNSAHKVRMP